MQSLPYEWYPSLPYLYLLSESGQNLCTHALIYISLSANILNKIKKKLNPKKKAIIKYNILVNSIILAYDTYCQVKLTKHTQRNSFMPQQAQKCILIYLRQNGSQYTEKQINIIWIDEIPIIALSGLLYRVVMMRASNIFFMHEKNQKYLVTVLQFVRIRYTAAVQVQSLIHSGLIVYYLIFKAKSPRITHYKAKNNAEKKAPVAANPLLKVKLPICVNTLILIQIKERQKKIIKKLSHTKLYNLLTYLYIHEVLLYYFFIVLVCNVLY